MLKQLISAAHAIVGGPLTIRTVPTGGSNSEYEWSVTYERRYRRGRTLAVLAEDSVRATDLEGALLKLLSREMERDAQLRQALSDQEQQQHNSSEDTPHNRALRLAGHLEDDSSDCYGVESVDNGAAGVNHLTQMDDRLGSEALPIQDQAV